jgi:hypothetical protein
VWTSHADRSPDPDFDCDINSNPDADRNPDLNSDAVIDRNPDLDSNADRNPDLNSDADRDPDSNADRDINPDAIGVTNSIPDADRNPDHIANPVAFTNPRTRHTRRGNRIDQRDAGRLREYRSDSKHGLWLSCDLPHGDDRELPDGYSGCA